MMSEQGKPDALSGSTTLTCEEIKEIERVGEALDFLFKGLREAESRFHEGKNAGRDGVIEAVEITIKFLLVYFPHFASGGLCIPLGALEDALMSLDDGLVVPLLKPAKPPRRGRVRASAFRACDKGTAAFTVTKLVATGVPKDVALEKVAQVFRKAGVTTNHGPMPTMATEREITARTIRGWCEKVNADVRRRGQAAQTFDLEMTMTAATPPSAPCLLDKLRNILALTRAAEH
jgi:hypothetical protein